MSPSPCYILGIASGYHDAAVALLRNGELVFAVAEERLSHLKHDASFPVLAIERCLDQAGIDPDALSTVVYYEIPSAKFLRILVSALATFPRGFGFFARSMQRWLPSQLWVKARICKELGLDPSRVQYCAHHLSHATHAFFNSPFRKALVLTVDAVGEWTCSSIALGDREAAVPVQILREQAYPSSLGLFYAAMTAFLGFQPNSDECSTMALAAWGQPRYADDLLRMLGRNPAQPGHLDLSSLDVNSFLPARFSPALLEWLGPARDPRQPLPFDCLQPGLAVDADAQRFADIAASVQSVLETVVQDLLAAATAEAGPLPLCLAGGVANNCVLVGKLLQQRGAGAVFVPVDPGDGGSAIGAALAGAFQRSGQTQAVMPGPFTGVPANDTDLPALLAALAGGTHPQTRGLAWQQYDSEAGMVEQVAQALAEGAIIGWVQGPCEFGPRALGGRSILCHPAREATVRRLGRDIKPRAAFRPYGLSMTESLARQACQGMEAGIPLPARWMQMAVPVRPGHRAALACALAVDGTTRPQVVCPAQQPVFQQLLEAVGHHTGVEAVLNTSFNLPGYPMVATALDALTAFLHMGLDRLVIGTLVITREAMP